MNNSHQQEPAKRLTAVRESESKVPLQSSFVSYGYNFNSKLTSIINKLEWLTEHVASIEASVNALIAEEDMEEDASTDEEAATQVVGLRGCGSRED